MDKSLISQHLEKLNFKFHLLAGESAGMTSKNNDSF